MEKKLVGFRLRPELDEKVNELKAIKEKETGVKLTRTQIIEMLINLGLENIKK